MLELTGVHAVSVARGCIGNPWIFRQARQLMVGQTPAAPTVDEQREALLMHFAYAVRLHGEGAASRMMRKFGIKFSSHHPASDVVKADFIRCASVDDWQRVVDTHYPGSGPASGFGAAPTVEAIMTGPISDRSRRPG